MTWQFDQMKEKRGGGGLWAGIRRRVGEQANRKAVDGEGNWIGGDFFVGNGKLEFEAFDQMVHENKNLQPRVLFAGAHSRPSAERNVRVQRRTAPFEPRWIEFDDESAGTDTGIVVADEKSENFGSDVFFMDELAVAVGDRQHVGKNVLCRRDYSRALQASASRKTL